jgi:hypothetical protein
MAGDPRFVAASQSRFMLRVKHMATKRGRLGPVTIGIAITIFCSGLFVTGLLVTTFVYVMFGPWEHIRGVNLNRDEYLARYPKLPLPESALNISIYTEKAWGNEEVVISFTVADEQTFLDWVKNYPVRPSPSDHSEVVTFDGGQLHREKIGPCLIAFGGGRGSRYEESAVYDRNTRHVYFHQITHEKSSD